MGFIYAPISLTNGTDHILAKKNIIGLDEVKEITVEMLVDTGSV